MSVKGAGEDVRFRLRVTGRVQGVFYRASTEEAAGRLGLGGFVRNTPDGAVEIEAQGPRDRVEELIRWCRRGPPGARVQQVEVTELTPQGSAGTFRVAY